MQTSVFTDHLKELWKHSAKLDTGKATHTDFINLQRLEARIINAPEIGYYSYTEYKSLYAIANTLHDDYRAALDLNR